MKIQNLVSQRVKSVINMSCCSLPSITINKITCVAQRDKFVTEIIVNVDCQHMGIFVIIFFFTFRLPTLLTNASLKNKNIKFNPSKYKKYNKYLRTLMIVANYCCCCCCCCCYYYYVFIIYYSYSFSTYVIYILNFLLIYIYIYIYIILISTKNSLTYYFQSK